MESKQYVNTIHKDSTVFHLLISCSQIDPVIDFFADETMRRNLSFSNGNDASNRREFRSTKERRQSNDTDTMARQADHIDDLNEISVSSLDEALQLLSHVQAQSHRCYLGTSRTSQNSHLMFSIKLIQTLTRHKAILNSKLAYL